MYEHKLHWRQQLLRPNNPPMPSLDLLDQGFFCIPPGQICDQTTKQCRDTNCNDPGYICPSNLVCLNKVCVYNPSQVCIPGTLPCSYGQVCEQNRCRPSTCLDPGFQCQGGSYCDPVTKRCVPTQGCYPACFAPNSFCDLTTRTCRAPNCLDPGYPCPSTQICDSMTKQCKSKGCIETGCPFPQKCFNGQCVNDNSGVTLCRYNGDCNSRNMQCLNGYCVPLPPTPPLPPQPPILDGQYCDSYRKCPKDCTCIRNICKSTSSPYPN